MPSEDTFKALTCLNSKEHKAYNSLQHCRVVDSEMSSEQPEKEITAGDEWMTYQELEVTGDDVKLRIDRWQYGKFCDINKNGKICLGFLPLKCRC